MNTDVDIHFIVGMARGGTTALGRLLSSHPDITVIGETSFFGRLYVPPRADGTYGDEEIERVRRLQRQRNWCDTTGDSESCIPLDAEQYAQLIDSIFRRISSPTSPKRLFTDMVQGIATEFKSRIVIEKTPHHVHWMDRLADAFPSARFLVCSRDPYEVVHSLRYMGKVHAVRRALERHPLVCATACRGYQRSIHSASLRYGERMTLVDNKDLRENPDTECERILQFLNADQDWHCEATQGGNSSFLPGQRSAVSTDEVLWVNLLCDAGSSYRHRPLRFEPLRLTASLALAPLGLLAAAAQLPARGGDPVFAYLTRWLSWRPSSSS